MTKSRFIFCVCLLIWVLFLISDAQRYFELIAQRIPGYPNSGQFDLYIVFPTVFVLLNIFLIIFSRKLPMPFRMVAFIIQLLVIPVFIFIGAGGV